MADIDMDNRDPNELNDHVKVSCFTTIVVGEI